MRIQVRVWQLPCDFSFAEQGEEREKGGARLAWRWRAFLVRRRFVFDVALAAFVLAAFSASAAEEVASSFFCFY